MRAWIQAQAVVSRTIEWRARHAIGADVQLWYGETEYVGPTRTAEDVDGDHWTDAHDNCIGLANPLQLDADNDGMATPAKTAAPTIRSTSTRTATGSVPWPRMASRRTIVRALPTRPS